MRSEHLLELHKNPDPLTYDPVRKKDLQPLDSELKKK